MMGKGCCSAVRKGDLRRRVGAALVLLTASLTPPIYAEPIDPGMAPCQRWRHVSPQPEAAGVSRSACAPEWVEGVANPGMDHRVFALTVWDDGNGPALYAGGAFASANGVSASCIAKWDGTNWSPLGLGVDIVVLGLGVFDPPGPTQGPNLYVCGAFVTAGGVQTLRIARWDGTAWWRLGSGAQGTVDRMTVHDDGLGGGPALYVGGQFVSMDGVPNTFHVARYNGTSWSALGVGIEDSVNDLRSFDEDGVGPNPPRLFAGGYFLAAGTAEAHYIAGWDGAAWSDVGGFASLNEHVHAFEVFDDGTGPALYVGGHFTMAGGLSARHIARWNGSSWSRVGGGFNSEVLTLTTFDDGSGAGPQLYAGGFFTSTIEGVPANFVAKWTGTSWVGLDTGLNDAAWALTPFDDGSGLGPALYAGGWFTTAGGLISRRVAQWDPADPAIRQPPSGLAVVSGEAAAFSVVATGSSPLSYRWRKDGIDLTDGNGVSGATEATLTIEPVVAGHAGDYDVVVTSGCGFVVSDSATLTVTGPPCMDLDDDGDVDASDYSLFEGCLTGPLGGAPPGCDAADCDADGDVDLAEFAVLQASFTAT